MLQGFEEITKDLNDFEINKVIHLIALGISTKIGKDKAISSSKICAAINNRKDLDGYKLTPVKLRKIMQAIRLSGKIMYLCSNSKGYYVAASSNELDDCIESLEQRVSQQQRVIDSMIWQRQQLVS